MPTIIEEASPVVEVEVRQPSYPDTPAVPLDEQRRAYVLLQMCNGDPAQFDANVLAKACDIIYRWLRDGDVPKPEVRKARDHLKPV